MNWVDFVIILIFIFYVAQDFRRGFLRLTAELVGLALAFLLALRYFSDLGTILVTGLRLSENLAHIISFVSIWIFIQIIVFILSKVISAFTPDYIRKSQINMILGLIPATLKAIIFLAFLLLLGIIAPISQKFQNSIKESFLGGKLVSYTQAFENKVESTLLEQKASPPPAPGETILEEHSQLGFSTANMTIDDVSENQMLDRINQERYNNNLKPLVADPLLRNVARAYSREMLIKGFFAHTNPTGATLRDRLVLAKVTYGEAAENLAFAPSIQLAHIGLMNSPKHRVNILDPDFTKIGIGVMDAGQYGKMFTQEFAN